MSTNNQVYRKSVVVSAHGDTNWREHQLSIRKTLNPATNVEELEYYGHMDNFAGVHAAMLAYFSGRLPSKQFRLEITYAEETTMEGARNVAATLKAADVVIVIDVTGTPTDKDFVIEKCFNKSLRKFVTKTLESHQPPLSFDIYPGCPDPVCSQDESDVYRKVTDFVFFLGVPVRGGDYNGGPVYCWKRTIDAIFEAVIALTNALVDDFDTMRNFPRQKEGDSATADSVEEAPEIPLFD